jgi:hypothetical protein
LPPHYGQAVTRRQAREEQGRRIYDCKQPYFSGLAGEPVPHWPQDYDLAGEVTQGELQGKADLEHAFAQALNGRKLRVGDVVALEDGRLYRCEMDGWSGVGRWRSAKRGRARAERMR